ncbi:MAG TPA: hypothetical protein VNY04_00565 [Chthoniobacterales bacterium]|nr:hypothetical protein [Chthoniobacterales bacterium]
MDQCRLAEELKEQTAPELLYVESKFAALMSYRLTADVLEELTDWAKGPRGYSAESRSRSGGTHGNGTWGVESVFHRRMRARRETVVAIGLAADSRVGWRFRALERPEVENG